MRIRCVLYCAAVGAAGVAILAVASPAAAQTASALLRDGDAVPGAPAETIDSISNSAVNHAGGYAFTINSTGSGTTLSHAWGNPAGGAGGVMRTEGTIGDYSQQSFESFFGISNTGQVAYSPSCTYTPSGSTGLDGVWLDDLPIAVEELPYPHLADWYWSFGSRPGVTANGQPYFVGGITDTLGGSTDNRGLFYGMDATPLLLGGDTVPNLPAVLSPSSTVSFDYRFSAMGSDYIAEVQMEGSTASDNAIVRGGVGLMVGGGLVREESPLPEAIGGLAGELWDNFDFLGVTESGKYMITGDSTAATSMDEFLLLNGQIAHREGDAVADGVYAGNIEGAYLNEQGDYAYIWELTNGDGNFEALFFNGELVLMEGDLIDWNGDGLIDGLDGGGVLDNFTGISALTLGDRVDGLADIYFTADVDFDGTTIEGGFRLTIPEPGSLALLALGTLALRRRR